MAEPLDVHIHLIAEIKWHAYIATLEAISVVKFRDNFDIDHFPSSFFFKFTVAVGTFSELQAHELEIIRVVMPCHARRKRAKQQGA